MNRLRKNISGNDSSKQNIIVFAVFLLALFLRLLGLINIELGGDFYIHWQVAGHIAQGKSFTLVGPSASINPVIHLTPFYYYLLSFPYLLGKGNFHFAVVFFSIINSLSIFPLFSLLNKWFSKRASYMAIILYAVSSYVIQVENFPWNPNLIPTLVIVCLYLLVKIRENQLNYLPLLFLVLGLGLSLHGTFLFIIPLFVLFIPFKQIPLKVFVLSIFIFGLTILPSIYYEINNNFIQTREIIKIFSPNKDDCVFLVWFKTHGNGERCFHQIRNTLFVFRLISQSLFSSSNIIFVLISATITIYTLIKSINPSRILLLLWISSILAFYMFYSRNVYLHYFLILIPFPFIIFIMFLDILRRNGKYGVFVSKFVFITILLWNIVSYLNSLMIVRR